MAPHRIFHQRDEGTYPGPEVVGYGPRGADHWLTQPPVAEFVVCRIHDRARDTMLVAE